jgi:hypothetical protein
VEGPRGGGENVDVQGVLGSNWQGERRGKESANVSGCCICGFVASKSLGPIDRGDNGFPGLDFGVGARPHDLRSVESVANLWAQIAPGVYNAKMLDFAVPVGRFQGVVLER